MKWITEETREAPGKIELALWNSALNVAFTCLRKKVRSLLDAVRIERRAPFFALDPLVIMHVSKNSLAVPKAADFEPHLFRKRLVEIALVLITVATICALVGAFADNSPVLVATPALLGLCGYLFLIGWRKYASRGQQEISEGNCLLALRQNIASDQV